MNCRYFVCPSIAGLCISLLVLLSACSKETPPLSIGSGGKLGNYYAVARAIAMVVNEEQETQGFLVQQQPTSGSVENIDGILTGDFAFGIAQADSVYQAVNGNSGGKGRGRQEELRAVFSLHTDSVTVVSTLASGIKTIQDLAGKRVDIGHPDSGSRQNAIDTLEAAGVNWQQDLTVYGDKPDDRASRYLRGELDAFFLTVGHPTMDIRFAVNSQPRVRLIPIANSPELVAAHPYYSRSLIPVELYPGVMNGSDVETVGVKAIFLTSSKTPDEVVYAITRAVFDGIDSLASMEPVLNTLSKTSMLEGLTVPLHPGALRYYEEAGLLDAASVPVLAQ